MVKKKVVKKKVEKIVDADFKEVENKTQTQFTVTSLTRDCNNMNDCIKEEVLLADSFSEKLKACNDGNFDKDSIDVAELKEYLVGVKAESMNEANDALISLMANIQSIIDNNTNKYESFKKTMIGGNE